MKSTAALLALTFFTASGCKQAATNSQAKEDSPGGAVTGSSDDKATTTPPLARADGTSVCIQRVQSSQDCPIVGGTTQWLNSNTTTCGHVESADGNKLEVFAVKGGDLVELQWAGPDAKDSVCPAIIAKADLSGAMVIAGGTAFVLNNSGALIYVAGDGNVFEILGADGKSLKLAGIAGDKAHPDQVTMIGADGRSETKPASYFAGLVKDGKQVTTVQINSRKSSMLGQDMQPQ